MNCRYLMLISGVLLILFTGCSSHHHGNYSREAADYWNKSGQDVSGLVEKHVHDPERVKPVNAVMGEIITEIKSARLSMAGLSPVSVRCVMRGGD